VNKIELLQTTTVQFKQKLAAVAAHDREIAAMLDDLTPLFSRISDGLVQPPAEGIYRQRFLIEHPRHGGGTPLFSAESDFLSALLDWRSQAGYPE
jgi:hypothetical protein